MSLLLAASPRVANTVSQLLVQTEWWFQSVCLSTCGGSIGRCCPLTSQLHARRDRQMERWTQDDALLLPTRCISKCNKMSATERDGCVRMSVTGASYRVLTSYNSGKPGNLREFVNSGRLRESSGILKFTQGICQMLAFLWHNCFVTSGFYFTFVWKRLIRGSGKLGEFNFAEFVSTLIIFLCDCVGGRCNVVGRDDISSDQKLDMIRHHLSQLPPAHYHTLKYLMAHLHRSVVHNSTKNTGQIRGLHQGRHSPPWVPHPSRRIAPSPTYLCHIDPCRLIMDLTTTLLLLLLPFYGSLDFVRDIPGEPVPEETFTHSYLSWLSVTPYLLPQHT